MHKIKLDLHRLMVDLIQQKVQALKDSIASALESRNSDTKSSAGDKHETSRALAQIEIEKLEVQLGKTLQLEKELLAIDLQKLNTEIGQGSLVFTSKEIYFFSIAMGKIVLNDQIYYGLSMASPIGQKLQHKKVGDIVDSQNRKIEIIEIA